MLDERRELKRAWAKPARLLDQSSIVVPDRKHAKAHVGNDLKVDSDGTIEVPSLVDFRAVQRVELAYIVPVFAFDDARYAVLLLHLKVRSVSDLSGPEPEGQRVRLLSVAHDSFVHFEPSDCLPLKPRFPSNHPSGFDARDQSDGHVSSAIENLTNRRAVVSDVATSTTVAGSWVWPLLLLTWVLLGIGYSAVQTPSGRLLRRSVQAADRPAVFAAQFALSHACWLLTYPLAGWLGAALPLSMTALAFAALTFAARVWPAGDAESLLHSHDDLPRIIRIWPRPTGIVMTMPS